MKNPTGIPQATTFALSTLGITLSLSSGDHFQSAFAAGCQTGKIIGVGPTKAIFWSQLRTHP